MKIPGCLITATAAFFAVVPATAGEPGETRTKTYDWGTITAPLAVHADGTARVEVSVHGAPEGAKLVCQMIYFGKGGAPVGYVLYPPAQDLTGPDGLYVFSVSCPQPHDVSRHHRILRGLDDTLEIVPSVFISDDGTWEGRSKHGEGPRIRLEKWCSVSAPHEARRGGRANIGVRLGPVPASNFLFVQLLLLDEDGKQVSVLHAAPAVVSESGGEHAFRFELPDTVEASKARPLVFLSPGGRWDDRLLNFDTADIAIDQ